MTKRHFDDELTVLRGRILHMGGLCEEMTNQAVKVLTDRDESLMESIQENENTVNDLHIEIDDRCLKMIALHQPAADDLRLITAAMKINSDLERIADQAVNISETSGYLLRLPSLKAGDIPRMVTLATSMLKDSLDAFAHKDVELAREVIKRDDEEDKLKTEVFSELLQIMQSDASTIQRAMEMILISRNLERIADHATNIAEDVIFMVLGKDIRHRSPDAEESERRVGIEPPDA